MTRSPSATADGTDVPVSSAIGSPRFLSSCFSTATNVRCHYAKVIDELRHLSVAGFVIGGPQNRRGMDCSDNRSRSGCNHFSTALSHAEVAAEQHLRRCCAECDDNSWLNHLHFFIEPCTARGNLHAVRLFVNPALAARFPFEVLYRIPHVIVISVNTGGRKCFVQNPTRRANKGEPLQICVVARLLADQHRFRARLS